MKPKHQNPLRSPLAVTATGLSRLPALAFVLTLPWWSSASAATETFNTVGTTTWTCPAGITSITVECWGGGGAGGAAHNTSTATTGTINVAGGGGAGGAYARRANVPVSEGLSYTIAIPPVATSPAGSAEGTRNSGGTVTFSGDGGITVTAVGGEGGACKVASATSTGAGGTGSTVGCEGEVFFAGGSSTAGGGGVGGGGGGAGDANPGGKNNTNNLANSNHLGGIGGLVGGGVGGTGPTGSNSGNSGGVPGIAGGGSGGRQQRLNGAARAGGAGGLGQIQITYTTPPVVKADNANNLNLGSSWVGGVVPDSPNFAIWDSTVTGANTTLLGADSSWVGIVIADPAGPVTINAGSLLTLGSAIDMSAATQDLTLNCALALGSANVWNVAGGQTLTLGGVVSGFVSVTKQGAGSVILSADNTYDGTTTISAGELVVGAGGTSGSLGAGGATGGGVLAFNRSAAVAVPNRVFGTSAATVPNLEIRSGSVTLAGTEDNAYLGATVKSGTTMILGKDSTVSVHALGSKLTTVETGAVVQLGGTGEDQVYDSGDFLLDGTFDLAGLNETMGGISGTGSIGNTGAVPVTLTVGGGNSPGDFSGAITDGAGGLSLVKTGTATQTLSGTLAYTGTTAVNGGMLNLVTGTGSSTTDTTIEAAGTLRTTVTNPGETWNLGGDLTCTFDSGIQFDFQFGTPGTTVAPLTVANLDTSGGNLEVDLLNLIVTTAGVYPLIAFNTANSVAGDFLAPDLPLGVLGSLKIVGNRLVLDVVEIHAPTDLTWTNGSTSGIWDKTSAGGPGDLNWKSTSLNPTAFYDTDSVTFDTAAFGGPIIADLTAPANVAGIVVGGPHDVTITNGGGSLSGTGGVTMNGTGVLDLQMDNSFTGKTLINAGTVVLNSATNDGTLNHSLGAIPAVATDDQITINGGTLVPTTNPTPTFNLSANCGVFVGASGGTISPATGKRLSIGRFTGDTNAVTTVGGDGTLAFGGDQLGYLGKWILKGSVVTIAGEGRLGTVDGGPEPDNVTLDGGHLQTTATGTGVILDDADRGITLTANGGRLSSNGANNGTYQIVIAGNAGGDLRIGDPANTNNGQRVTFNAAHTYHGKTIIDRGSLILGSAGSLSNSPEIVLGGDAPTTLDVSGAPAFVLGTGQTLSGTGSVLGPFTSAGAISPGAATGALNFSSTLGLGSGTLKIEVDDAQSPAVSTINVTSNLNVTTATLNLDINGPLTAQAYVIATYGSLTGPQFAAITGDAIPAGYALAYNHNGNSIALVQQGGFAAWIASFFGGETNPNIVGPNADPDQDGVENIVEFALGGSAPNSGSAMPGLFERILSDHLTLTVPVLNVATFAGNPPSATVQGVTVTVEGSDNLGSFAIGVETTTPSTNAPAAPAGYTNHGFRLIPTVSGNPHGFLRVKVE